jgi:cytochrome P450
MPGNVLSLPIDSDLDVSSLRAPTAAEVLEGLAVTLLTTHTALRLIRRFRPTGKVPFSKLSIVTRHEDVQELLRQDQVFQVEGERIRRANGDGDPKGPNFLLGLQEDAGGCPMRHAQSVAGRAATSLSYCDFQSLVMKVFEREDLPRIGALVEKETRAQLNSLTWNEDRAEFDAIQTLITRIPVMLCERYYGLRIPHPADFARCAFVVSRWIFDPDADSNYDEIGTQASQRLNRIIKASLDQPMDGDTIISRLRRECSDDVIQTVVFGMIVALVPTNTMAGGHILQMLIEHEPFQDQARTAADPFSGDDDRLQRCLFEAMRFFPLLREPLRVCARDYTLAEGTHRQHRFKKGERIIAITKSAMMDERAIAHPQRFDPDRPAYDRMVFGYGLHRCIGAPIAEMQMRRMFKVLLHEYELGARKGAKMERLVTFPEHYIINLKRLTSADRS